VVSDIRGSNVSAEPQPTIYRPYAQAPPRFATIILRGNSNAGLAWSDIRAAVREVDKELAVASLQQMEVNIAKTLAGERSRMMLLILFALAALILSTVGLYALLVHLVDQRRPEFGIRMALGASQADVLRVAMRRGIRISILGISLGLFLAIVLARGLEATLFRSEVFHYGVFAAGILSQAAVALIACYLPSRKAARLEPAAILRSA
jgi:putative ABC transport system permease protein